MPLAFGADDRAEDRRPFVGVDIEYAIRICPMDRRVDLSRLDFIRDSRKEIPPADESISCHVASFVGVSELLYRNPASPQHSGF